MEEGEGNWIHDYQMLLVLKKEGCYKKGARFPIPQIDQTSIQQWKRKGVSERSRWTIFLRMLWYYNVAIFVDFLLVMS